MSLKSAYQIKLFLLITLSAVLLASVETAPERPVLFAAVAAACILLIRLLWKSAQRDEKRLVRQKARTCRLRAGRGAKATGGPPDLNRAA